MTDHDGGDIAAEDAAGLFDPIPRHKLPTIPAAVGAAILFEIVMQLGLTQIHSDDDMTAWLHENKRTLNVIRDHRADLWQRMGAAITARRAEFKAAPE
ncbi:hypothetical protein [Ferrovibrio terrae]|uniref:hypothetical protein n=1 Tax=Ferrovibrio terrae TaxID=2594003 RepID=UPI0031378235